MIRIVFFAAAVSWVEDFGYERDTKIYGVKMKVYAVMILCFP